MPAYYGAVASALLITAATLCVNARMTGPPDAGVPIWVMARVPEASSSQKEYQLRRSGDGYAYKERVFEAKVARDGVVTFHDRRVFFDHVGLLAQPQPGAGATETLQGLLFGRKAKRPRSRRCPARPPTSFHIPSSVPPTPPAIVCPTAFLSRGAALRWT